MYLAYWWRDGLFCYDVCDHRPTTKENVICIDSMDTDYEESDELDSLWGEYDRMVRGICEKLDVCDEATKQILIAELAGMERAMRLFVKYEY